ncbi:hypothetical protein FACS1894111_08760 [Clostridia bacterium]|nr:hypothetical protein FACS1894111_08760 [Clostridia bacterium]
MSNATITLYHGTAHEFTNIDVRKGKFFKDFGRGFYTTLSYEHAASIGERNRKMEQNRLKELGSASSLNVFVYSYEFALSALDKLKIQRFETPNIDWVNFVVENRSIRNAGHEYDLIIGPTANDDTRVTIQNYLLGNFGELGSKEAVAIFLQLIKAEKLPTQWMFATQKAVGMLDFLGKEQLR